MFFGFLQDENFKGRESHRVVTVWVCMKRSVITVRVRGILSYVTFFFFMYAQFWWVSFFLLMCACALCALIILMAFHVVYVQYVCAFVCNIYTHRSVRSCSILLYQTTIDQCWFIFCNSSFDCWLSLKYGLICRHCQSRRPWRDFIGNYSFPTVGSLRFIGMYDNITSCIFIWITSRQKKKRTTVYIC